MDFCLLGAGKEGEEENGSTLLTCFLPCGFLLILPPANYACVVCAREISPWRRHAPGGGWEHLFCLFCLWVVIRPFLLCKKTRMNKRKKKEEKREGQDTSKETTHGQDGDVDGMGWMDGRPFFPCYLPSITAIAIRYLAVGSG